MSQTFSSIPGHAEAVISTNFSPSGKQLASGSGDTTVRFWDLQTQTPLHVCKGYYYYCYVRHCLLYLLCYYNVHIGSTQVTPIGCYVSAGHQMVLN